MDPVKVQGKRSYSSSDFAFEPSIYGRLGSVPCFQIQRNLPWLVFEEKLWVLAFSHG